MEKGGLARWLLLGIAAFIMVTLMTKQCGDDEAEHQSLQYDDEKVPDQRDPEELCNLKKPCNLKAPDSDCFHAQLTTKGASIKRFKLLKPKYQKDGQEIDLSTTPDLQPYRQLRFDWRNEALANQKKVKEEDWQVDFDLLDWKLDRADGKSCKFSYRDQKVELSKTISVTGKPYELEVRATITNLADRTLTHALTVHTAAWLTHEETKGAMFRVSPYITHVECVTESGDATRLAPDDFEPADSKEEEGAFKQPVGWLGLIDEECTFKPHDLNTGHWCEAHGPTDVAAVSNAYFSHAVVPVSEPRPRCQLQIEPRGGKTHPLAGHFYRARLAYPSRKLAPNVSAEYVVLSYIGPKERDALAAAGGGQHNLVKLIDLGFFAVIAKVLVDFLLKVYSVIPNWGIAIIILTITARTLLFPLAIPSIKSMIKMREIKPEIDALNEKYKDNPQQKGLAQMELWRKHKVNPLKGCLPQLASMPVWFALYTTLQTAVELYNIPFLWFDDLSQPDQWFVLPFVIGGTNFIQMKLMPMAGGDPAQQKMMLYFMPAMFTVFMLFLPSGLGVYMFTNGVLGIVQQQIVQWHVGRTASGGTAGKGGDDLKVRIKELKDYYEESDKPQRKGRRKRKSGGTDSSANFSKSRPLLDKGKA